MNIAVSADSGLPETSIGAVQIASRPAQVKSTMGPIGGVSEISPVIYIESQLGLGGNGTVYKAWHKRLRNDVVVKEIKHNHNSNINMYRNEVEALKNVKSAYLPQVLDFMTKGDYSYTVMEFIDGESFDKLLERGRIFTENQVSKWYEQLASALEAIHKQNICHRDIKPANIMLMPSGDVCLIDFNAALVRGNDTRLISRSPGYASPEQHEYFQRLIDKHCFPSEGYNRNNFYDSNETELVGISKLYNSVKSTTPTYKNSELGIQKAEYSPGELESAAQSIDWKLSDIYSLGATMYHLFTGKCPYEMRKDLITNSIKAGRSSKSISTVIERSMRHQPTERYSSAKQLSEAIRDISEYHMQQRNTHTIKAAAIASVGAIAMLLSRKKHDHCS